jgi:hypothetical protein
MAGIHFIGPNILSYNPPAAPGYVTDGLTAFWEVASGDTSTWTDITGNGNDLYATGSVSKTGDYYTLGGSDGANAWFARWWSNSTTSVYNQATMTTEGYVFVETTGGGWNDDGVWQAYRGDAQTIGWPQGCTNGFRGVIGIFASPVVLCTTTTLSQGNWYHIAQVYDDTAKTAKLYLNGVLDTSTSYTGNRVNAPVDWRMRVGVVDNGTGFNIRAGNLRVYKNKALTADEVLQNYDYDKALYGLS